MKKIILFLSFFFAFLTGSFSQVILDSTFVDSTIINSKLVPIYDDSIIRYDGVKIQETYYTTFNTDPVEVFLYPGKIIRDTIVPCEFTYVKNNGTVKHAHGQIVRVAQQWMSEPDGGSVVLSKTIEQYIIADNRMRYELNDYYFYKTLMTSKTIYPKGFLSIFKRKPEFVLNITKVFPQ